MTTVAACRTCGTELREGARFCDGCGAPVQDGDTRAEYKQVTVLFADVVHSMDIAAAVGAERLREIMAQLADRCAAVVQRYGGTVDKFTGDGIMAVFGAPVALEDHASRACRAALDIQAENAKLAKDVEGRDGIALQLRVGLNSGQVIAGEIGSGPFGYTAVGEQVGMAQRMESVAPPGGVMLSASTARLVEGVASLGEPELVHIKGTDQPVHAQRLLGMPERDRPTAGAEAALVGRRWEMAAVEGLLDRAIDGHGAVATVVGSPGIGKSRLAREVAAIAAGREVEVFTAFCESHTTDIAFHVVAQLLRAATGVRGLDALVARDRVRSRVPDADPEDMLLFDDLLGIADPEVELPKIDPDARRRRLTALVNAASLARQVPAVYVIEDAHWIDEVSESMIADFLTVIPQTPSLVLVTYRPEYRGVLTQVAGAQTIALAPLSDSETAALISELLGPDPSAAALGQTIAERAAGNPFFAEEIVRDLAERGVLQGQPGAYVSTTEAAEVNMPATVQATIAARIDRVNPGAKRTLSAAAVIGSKFSRDLLDTLGVDPDLGDLVRGEFLDQISFSRSPEYVFHHPLIRTVAYESQLKSDRVELHRRLATAIEARDPGSADDKAALIAEHLEAAGDLHAAYGWHMRAGAWSTTRDIAAAQTSWRRAIDVADKLPDHVPDRMAMRIAPRALLCAIIWRIRGSSADPGFDELRELCAVVEDRRSLAIGLTGLVMAHAMNLRLHEASCLAKEHIRLLEAVGDPELTVALAGAALTAWHENGEMADILCLTDQVVDLAGDDPTMGDLVLGSPLAVALAVRGSARWCLGVADWRQDYDRALAMARASDPITSATVVYFVYSLAIANGALLSDESALFDSAEALRGAQRSGDNVALILAKFCSGIALVHHDGPRREEGIRLLAESRDDCLRGQMSLNGVLIVDLLFAREKARLGDLDNAIALARAATDDLFGGGSRTWGMVAVTVLVETLFERGAENDLFEAEAAIDRLAAAPADEGLVIRELWLLRLRALLARAHGYETAYRDLRDRYRAMATSLGFEGHMKWAEAMP